MHIPDQMLNGAVCPVTAAVSAAGVAGAAYFAMKTEKKPAVTRFAAVTSFIFAAQMMNFPVQNGTSGHLIGAVLAGSLLGSPFGVLAMSIVLAVQTLIFSDGGFTALGANILNMALVASVSGILFNRFFSNEKSPEKNNNMNKEDNLFNRTKKEILSKSAFLFGAAWLSVVLAAFTCSIELAISGTVSISKVLPSMLSVHALIGLGEGLITLAGFLLFSSEKFSQTEKRSFVLPLSAAGIIGLMLSPFASGYPDGLEWIAEKYNFLHESAPAFTGLLNDYALPVLSNEIISTGLAGIFGVLITFGASAAIAKGISLNKIKTAA